MSIIYPQDSHDIPNKSISAEVQEKAAVNYNTEDAASPLSLLFMTYLNPLFKVGFERVISFIFNKLLI